MLRVTNIWPEAVLDPIQWVPGLASAPTPFWQQQRWARWVLITAFCLRSERPGYISTFKCIILLQVALGCLSLFDLHHYIICTSIGHPCRLQGLLSAVCLSGHLWLIEVRWCARWGEKKELKIFSNRHLIQNYNILWQEWFESGETSHLLSVKSLDT